ncbi:MAG TPA: CdaR family protein [Candidatus Dormibacteraeota bacterium]|nr:CdaR family protein [Candidatus Dormibacteraeota bacterium]
MFGNLRLKLLAIFFAVALWSVVAYTSNPTTSQKFRVRLDSPVVPAGLVIVGDVPQVSVTVTATAENFHGFDPRSLHVIGNFTNVKVGPNQVPIRVDSGDSAVLVDAPSTVAVTMDQLAKSSMAVSIVTAHSLPSGFHEQPNATSITPSTVEVEGPKTLLATAEAVVLVDLADPTQLGTNLSYIVVVRDTKTKKPISSKVTPPEVQVKIVIQADAVTQAKPVGFTLTGQPASGYRITKVTIEPLTVQATGLQSTLAQLNLLTTDPVDVTNQKSDVVKTVAIHPPNGVEVNQKTATVHVYISQIPGVSPSP